MEGPRACCGSETFAHRLLSVNHAPMPQRDSQESRPSQPRPPRVFILGMSASGKTTLGQALAQAFGVEWIGLDQIAGTQGWNWLQRPRSSVSDRQSALQGRLNSRPSWVVEGGYLWWTADAIEQADLVIWLDLHWSVTLRRLVGRIARSYWFRVSHGRPVSRLKALLKPGAMEVVHNLVQTWRIRPRGFDFANSTGHLEAPKGDMDEMSMDSLERTWLFYQGKYLRIKSPTSTEAIVAAVKTKLAFKDGALDGPTERSTASRSVTAMGS